MKGFVLPSEQVAPGCYDKKASCSASVKFVGRRMEAVGETIVFDLYNRKARGENCIHDFLFAGGDACRDKDGTALGFFHTLCFLKGEEGGILAVADDRKQVVV